jgi:hypothetical protein
MQERGSPLPQPHRPVAQAAVVTLGDDGIMIVDFRHCERVTLPIIEAAHARHLALCPDRKVPVLMRGDHVGGVDYAAQRFGSSPSVCQVFAALGLVVASFLERHLARMFLMYHRPPYPTRVFDDEQMARNWLRGFLDQG